MIVWNASRRFFPLKAKAEDHRRALGLPVEALIKIEIQDRFQLAELLNGLSEAGEDRNPVPEHKPNIPLTSDIPGFLLKAWAKLEAGWKGNM